jgi:hypothetical protein
MIFEWLSDDDHGIWLIVLDNTDDSDTFFKLYFMLEGFQPVLLARYLPRSSNGSIIITTRDTRVGERLVNREKSILVSLFDEKKARLLLCSKLSEKKDLIEEDILELLKILGYLPLAITQAAAFINENYISLAKYINMLRADDSELAILLNKSLPDNRRDDEASNSVLQTWKLLFDQIQRQHPRAAQMFSLMAVLDRQGIPKFLLQRDKERESELIIVLEVLQAFSLITAESGGETFILHRLVQLFTISWLELQNEKEHLQEEALQLLSTNFPNGEYKNRKICEILSPHAQIILNYYYTSDSSLLHLATLLYNSAWFEWRQGRYNIAHQYSK